MEWKKKLKKVPRNIHTKSKKTVKYKRRGDVIG